MLCGWFVSIKITLKFIFQFYDFHFCMKYKNYFQGGHHCGNFVFNHFFLWICSQWHLYWKVLKTIKKVFKFKITIKTIEKEFKQLKKIFQYYFTPSFPSDTNLKWKFLNLKNDMLHFFFQSKLRKLESLLHSQNSKLELSDWPLSFFGNGIIHAFILIHSSLFYSIYFHYRTVCLLS